MSLHDFTIIGRDKFEPIVTSSGFSFPCNSCKHNKGDDDEEPCRTCEHNLNAVTEE